MIQLTMLRLTIAPAFYLLAASTAFAVQDVDGSYAGLPSAAQAATERLITDTFRDPVSAQFRRIRLIKNSGDQVICGEVNLKNGFGAYVGFEKFAIAKHPDGRTSTYNPHSMLPEVRPLIRRIIGEQGCDADKVNTVPATSSTESLTISSPLIKKWAIENEACRGGPGDAGETARACDRRERVSVQLRSAGLCYGREGEAGYQENWHRCEPGSRQR